MLPLMAIPALIGGAQAAAGAIGMLLNKRPKYEIPAAARQQLGLSQAQAGSDMPQYAQAQADLGTSMGNALAAARESGNPLAAIGMIQANQNKGLNDLNTANANYHTNRLDALGQNLGQFANYQNEEWQINKYAPYAERKALFQNLIGGGIKNIAGSVDSMNAQNELSGLMGRNGSVTNQLGMRSGQIPMQNQLPSLKYLPH